MRVLFHLRHIWIWLYDEFGYVVNLDMHPIQMTKMSSMNHFHNIMCGLPSSFNFSSNFPINKFAYAGAILVATHCCFLDL